MYINVNTKFNDKFKERMNCNYGKHDEVKANRGKVHEYLGMTFDFTEKANTKIKMDNYVESMINDLSMETSKMYTDLTPAGNNIAEKGNRKRMGKKET